MKIRLNITYVITLLLLLSYKNFACSSFVIYPDTNRILYGMNFDYPETEIKFEIKTKDSLKIFDLSFLKFGYFYSTVGMNSNGFFSSCQMLYPELKEYSPPEDTETTIGNLYYESIFTSDNVHSLLNSIKQSRRKIVHNNGSTLHNIFADKFGNAAVFEISDSFPIITYAKDNFLVMTNFPNRLSLNNTKSNEDGIGSKRYKIATQIITDNYNSFGIEEGLQLLKEISQTEGEYKTLCSMLFDPVTLEIFVIIDHNFEKIWRVDLNKEVITSYRGFDEKIVLPFQNKGILGSDLEKYMY